MRQANGSVQVVAITHKPTGERFYVERKKAWDRYYYRADSDGEWASSVGEAMRGIVRSVSN